MPKIHTHYDNLKVTRNAPPEVIRAAYKTLSQKYHPDRNLGNSDAARVMAIINSSYDVLIDPDKRKAHDIWIAQQELDEATSTQVNKQFQQNLSSQTALQPVASISSKVIAHILGYWGLYAIAAVFISIWISDKPNTPPAGPKPYLANPETVKLAYIRPSFAPNGQAWPSTSGYLKGTKQLNNNGLSKVTVDNSKNDSDVFVKLVSITDTNAHPVREFFIPAFGSFSLNRITAGSYDIRYRDLSDGGLSRSESFTLKEIPIASSTQYSNVTMTLYKVKNGNMQTYGLDEAEF